MLAPSSLEAGHAFHRRASAKAPFTKTLWLQASTTTGQKFLQQLSHFSCSCLPSSYEPLDGSNDHALVHADQPA